MKKSCVPLAAIVVGLSLSACGSLSGGPDRLYSIDEESQGIRKNLESFTLQSYTGSDEDKRRKYRDDWIAARMYAIDIQYTAYEGKLTTERQKVGFGAAAATLGLTTASGLATSTMSKDILTGLAGAVTGTHAAYDNDVLLAHSTQWVQTQMRTQRTLVAERILRGLKLSTLDYPIAEALRDLEDYYRAGTFTGGVLGTSAALGAEEKYAEDLKGERIELAFSSTPAGLALLSCTDRPGAKAQLLKLLPTPSGVNPEVFLVYLQTGKSPGTAQEVLRKARNQGICQ